jgi:hypothetical protein
MEAQVYRQIEVNQTGKKQGAEAPKDKKLELLFS